MCDHHLRKDKAISDIDSWLYFLIDRSKLESVCYAGGDPFTIKRMNEVMDFHIKNDIAFGFITCGFLPDWIDLKLLKKARWDPLLMSCVSS